jgi:hypothetical protein
LNATFFFASYLSTTALAGHRGALLEQDEESKFFNKTLANDMHLPNSGNEKFDESRINSKKGEEGIAEGRGSS